MTDNRFPEIFRRNSDIVEIEFFALPQDIDEAFVSCRFAFDREGVPELVYRGSLFGADRGNVTAENLGCEFTDAKIAGACRNAPGSFSCRHRFAAQIDGLQPGIGDQQGILVCDLPASYVKNVTKERLKARLPQVRPPRQLRRSNIVSE